MSEDAFDGETEFAEQIYRAKHRPHRRASLVALGADVRSILAPVLKRKGALFVNILSHWEDIVGAAAKGSEPLTVSFPKGAETNGVLHLKASSGAYATAISAQSAEIIAKINAFAGYNAVGALKITQGAIIAKKESPRAVEPPVLTQAQKDEIGEAVKDIESPELRDALTLLGTLLKK